MQQDVHKALFVTVKKWKQSKCPMTNKWLNRFTVLSLEVVSSRKNNILKIHYVNVLVIILSEKSPHTYTHICLCEE